MQGSPISPGGCTLDVHGGALPVPHPKCVLHLQWAVTKASVPFPVAGMYQSSDCCCIVKVYLPHQIKYVPDLRTARV